jgi:hypothetical protein
VPFPAGATTITVTGTFPVPVAGTARAGSVVFTPSAVLVDSTQKAIYSGAGTVTLDAAARFSTTLLCTDDTDVQPTGWRWRVDEQPTGGQRRTYYVDLPSTLGATVDLSQLSPVSAPDGSGQSLPPSGPAGGALTGSYPNPQLSAATIAGFVPNLATQRFLTASGDPAADAAAINAAILAVAQAGGGRVQLSGQAWSVSSSITPRSNVTLAGMPGTVITHTGNSNIVYGSAIAFTSFTLEDLTFAGPVNELPTGPKRSRTTSGAGAQTAVFLTGDLDTTGSGQAQLTDFTMRRCTVKNMTALPVRIGGVRGRVVVTQCEFINNQDAGFIFCEEVEFSGNHVYASADNGVSLSRGCKKVTCVGNRIENVAYNGIWISGFNTDKGPQNFTVAANVIKNVGHNGIYADYAPRYGTIIGNEIDCGYYRGPSDQPTDIQGTGIYLGGYPITDRTNPTDWAQGIVVADNHVRAAARAGVYLTGVRRALVTSNLIADIGTQFLADGTTTISNSDATTNVGVLMENASTSANVTIALNDVIDSRGTPFCNFGLVPQNTASINAYLNTMVGTRQASNLLETGPTRTVQAQWVFNQNIRAVSGATAGSNAGAGTISGFDVNGAAGSVRPFAFLTAGLKRWFLRATSDAESGSNGGTNFELNAYDDSGNLLSTPIRVTRSNGQVAVNGTLAQNAHRVSGASAVTVAAGAQSASATAGSNGANDSSGTVNTTAIASPAAGTIATITYASAYATAPKVTLTPRNTATVAAGLYATSEGTGGFSVATANAPTGGASLSFSYHVEG